MFYEGYASQFNNPAPFNSKVYVAADIFQYCKSAGKDVGKYVSSIEAGINPNSTFIEYNPKNGDHVNDVINEGSVLVSMELRTTKLNLPPVAGMLKDARDERREFDPGFAQRFVSQFENTEKNKTINMLKSMGIEYEGKGGNPLVDEDSYVERHPSLPVPGFNVPQPRPSSPQKNSIFSKLVEELNK